MDLSAEARSTLGRGRLIALSFVAGSLAIPAAGWSLRPSFTAVPIPLAPAMLAGMVVVAILVAGGLALRNWLDVLSIRAGDEAGFHSLRLLAVTLPCALAEAAALAVALLGGFTGLAVWHLLLLVPPYLALALCWPRAASEAGAEREFRRRREAEPGR